MTTEPAHKLPFTFAKRYGVLLNYPEEGHAKVIYHHLPEITILNELRRYACTPVVLEKVDEETFNKLLVKSYETDSNTAMLLAEDLGESMNLFDLIHELPKPED